MTEDKGKYSGRAMWLLISIWSIIMVWISYVAYEHMNWDGTLWFALLVTYIAIVFIIIAYADIDWSIQ